MGVKSAVLSFFKARKKAKLAAGAMRSAGLGTKAPKKARLKALANRLSGRATVAKDSAKAFAAKHPRSVKAAKIGAGVAAASGAGFGIYRRSRKKSRKR